MHQHEDHDHGVILLDENGEEQVFELVVTLDVGEKTYAILAQDGSEDAFAVRIEGDLDDEEAELVPVVDDEEFAMVAAAYDELDFEEEEA
ncbi:MAG: DUF1292 domain-containing protein [Eubacteriaceae bacterium]|nr:DUF1292 domain-containing protein [Eubacteriaceae bacterium]MBR0383785.1 DUF1292 domain-containing protein [Eubacteriaceae bacterium]